MILVGTSGCFGRTGIDQSVTRVISARQAGSLTVSTDTLTDAFSERESTGDVSKHLSLGRIDTLRYATRFSRQLQNQREALYLAGLDLRQKQRDFGIQISGTLDYLLGLSSDDDDESGSLSLGADRQLATGASLALSAESTRRESDGPTNTTSSTYSSALSARLTQPLLAGAGYKVSHEPLTQSERDLLYALRDFSLQRQDFALEILGQYYQVINQKSVLDNTRLNLEQSTFLRKRSQSLFKVRMATAIDVLRSQQQELTTRNQLNAAEANYDVSLKRLLITLGAPSDRSLEIVGDFPDVRGIELDIKTCIETALEYRLDLRNSRDRLEDTKRKLDIAANSMLPHLDVFADVAYRGSGDSPGDQKLEDHVTAGISLELPLDKRDERDAVVRARISSGAARRDYESREETVRVDIIENFRRLESFSMTVMIQKQNTTIAEKRARNALLRFKGGELSNRDVVEAENELLDARNAYSQALVDYELQRLRLLRNIGLLDVEANGDLRELDLMQLRSTTERVET
jgi:outer membrane protein TolC